MANRSSFVVRLVNGIHISFVMLALVLLVTMTLIIAVNVFMRYVLNSGLTWAEEIAKLLVVWFTFISMAVGVKQGLHIRIQILPKNLPSWLCKAVDTMKDLLVLALGSVMLVYGIKLIGFTNRSIMPATGLPSSLLYFILPFSGALVMMEAIIDLSGANDDAEKVESFLSGGTIDD